jgi:hypothetical protein
MAMTQPKQKKNKMGPSGEGSDSFGRPENIGAYSSFIAPSSLNQYFFERSGGNI